MPYYAVAKGSKTGVYNNWNDCKDQVNGYSGASYKKFNTAAEASAFVANGGNTSTRSSGSHSSSGYSGGGFIGGSSLSRVSKSSSGGYSGVGFIGGSSLSMVSNSSSGSSSSSSSNASKSSRGSSSSANTSRSSRVYVDGASRGNGKSSTAPSGYGVYYGPDDSRNAAVPLDHVDGGTSHKPTNQRAELHGIKHALKNIHNDLKLGKAAGRTEIHSDSRYAIQSVDEWSNKWATNGWKNSKGETIANHDLIRETVALKNDVNKEYQARNWGNVEFVHVKGHSGNPGNEAADRLANQGADNYGRRK